METETETETMDPGGGADPGQSAPPKVAEKAPEPEKDLLPEDFKDWKLEHFEQAKQARDLRLREAVAYLGENFAGQKNADEAAKLLRRVLEQSEESRSQAQAAASGGNQGAEMTPEDGTMEDMPADYSEAEAGMMEDPAMSEEYAGMDPDGPGMSEESRYPGEPGARYGSAKQDPKRLALDDPAFVSSIMHVMGDLGSKLARQTVNEVVEGEFATDNNRVATLASLETMVKHLDKPYEDLLFRCLSEPEELRELSQQGSAGGGGAGMEYSSMEDPGMMGEDMSGMDAGVEEPPYGRRGSSGRSRRGRGFRPAAEERGRKPLSAEELQKRAFALIAPTASEDLRLRLARHLAKPDSIQEDHDLFGGFLRESHPKNVAAQVVLFFDKNTDERTRESLGKNFLVYSSDAMGGVLGIPERHRAGDPRRRAQRQRRRGTSRQRGMRGAEGPGMEGMSGVDAGMEDPGMEDPAMEDPGMMEPAMEDPAAMGGMQEGGAPAGKRRPSRYDRKAQKQPQPGAGPDSAREDLPLAEEKPDPDLPFRMAKHFWGPQMTASLIGRLRQVHSIDANAELLAMASTIPNDSVRAALFRTLKANWEDGPEALEAAGILEEVVCDPGFFPLVKLLPREKPANVNRRRQPTIAEIRRMRQERAGGGRQGRAPGGAGGREDAGGAEAMPGMEGGEVQGGMQKQEPGLAWMTTSEELLRLTCERLFAASGARARGMAGAQAGPGKEDFPVELHPSADKLAEYYLEWPAGASKKLAGVPLGGIKLRYVRTEQIIKQKVIMSYYIRKLPKADAFPIESGAWLELNEKLPEPGWKRSIDLLFTAAVSDADQTPDIEMPVTVDILCIDMKDVSGGAAD